jgi:hypothetical protein
MSRRIYILLVKVHGGRGRGLRSDGIFFCYSTTWYVLSMGDYVGEVGDMLGVGRRRRRDI